MNFYLYSDVDPGEGTVFPPGLSQFYEQYKGFGNESEVAQVSELLKIDLTPFQKYNVAAEEVIWHDIDALIALNQLLRQKVQATPDLYARMKYCGPTESALRAELMKAAISGDKKKMEEIVKRFQNTPDSAYPPDVEFIKRGFLLRDILELDKILLAIKKKGGTRINIVYA